MVEKTINFHIKQRVCSVEVTTVWLQRVDQQEGCLMNRVQKLKINQIHVLVLLQRWILSVWHQFVLLFLVSMSFNHRGPDVNNHLPI